MMTKQYCTTKSAATRLGISRERVRQLAVGGHIPARREGAHWFFELDDIERLAATPPPRRWGPPIEPTSSKTISPNALAVLAFVIRFKRRECGDSPTYREIQRGAGVSSTSMVRYYLNALEGAGMIHIPQHRPGGAALRIQIPGAEWVYDDTDLHMEAHS